MTGTLLVVLIIFSCLVALWLPDGIRRVMTGIILMEMVSWLMVGNPSVANGIFSIMIIGWFLTDGIILMV